MTDLLERIEGDFERLEVRSGTREKVMPLILTLRDRDEGTFEHSVRVAYLGEGIARYTRIVAPRTIWLPGLLHDIGKLGVDPNCLRKRVGFNGEDMEKMKRHVEYGCKLLVGLADFSAIVTFYHHYFNPDSAYPAESDFKKIFGDRFDKWSEGSKTLAKYCGRLVSLADVWDALTTRENDRFSPGRPRLPSTEEAIEVLVKENRDQRFLIGGLSKEGVFGGQK